MAIGNTYLYLFHAVNYHPKKIDCIIGYALSGGSTYIEYYLSQSEFYISEAMRITTNTTSTSSADGINNYLISMNANDTEKVPDNRLVTRILIFPSEISEAVYIDAKLFT